MLKRGVLIFVFLISVNLIYAQESLKGDFNNDCEVDLEDFFLFADQYEKNVYRDNEKFDLDGKGTIDIEDLFIFADQFEKKCEGGIEEIPKFDVGEECKEVFPGFNGPVNERVNLVFLSFNYENIDKFLEKVKSLSDPDSSKSFFSFEPIASNKNKFNLWYVDKAEQTLYQPTAQYNPLDTGRFNPDAPPEDLRDFFEKESGLFTGCINIPARTRVNVELIKGSFRPSANPFFIIRAEKKGRTGDVRLSNDASYGDLIHEFLHAFGKHSDEYTLLSYAWTQADSVPLNCDVATSDVACSKWCRGSSVSVDSFKKFKCSGFDVNTCVLKTADTPCFPVFGSGRLGSTGDCINIIDFCMSMSDKISCEDTRNNFYNGPVCTWSEEKHLYYNSNCIPPINSINIGTQCAGGTGCYNSCGQVGLFRSEADGMLQSVRKPLGSYNEKILCDRIKDETGSVGGKCNELFGLFK